uniref:GOLD domain-containing protein n=1 Tax=Oryctolagus cuniculus TaxID=9986 RepID=G1U2V7_RABIT
MGCCHQPQHSSGPLCGTVKSIEGRTGSDRAEVLWSAGTRMCEPVLEGRLDSAGTFKIQLWDLHRHDFLESAPGLGLFVTVTTYNEEVLLSALYGPQGTFYFTSHSPGEHIICLVSNSTRLLSFGGSKLRIHLHIRVGEHNLDEVITQAKDRVNEVTFKLEHLLEQVEQILKEQNYQRDREESFRVTSEDTHSNVLRWAFAQTLVLLAVGRLPDDAPEGLSSSPRKLL